MDVDLMATTRSGEWVKVTSVPQLSMVKGYEVRAAGEPSSLGSSEALAAESAAGSLGGPLADSLDVSVVGRLDGSLTESAASAEQAASRAAAARTAVMARME